MTKQKSEYDLVMPQPHMTWRHEKQAPEPVTYISPALPELRQTKAYIKLKQPALSTSYSGGSRGVHHERSLEPKLPPTVLNILWK